MRHLCQPSSPQGQINCANQENKQQEAGAYEYHQGKDRSQRDSEQNYGRATA